MKNWQPPGEEMTLTDDAVHIWLFQLNISQARISQFYPLLDENEKQRSERFVNFIHRKRFIAAHGFMRTALASYLDQTAQKLQFTKGKHGKPELLNHDDNDIQFNLSHSHNLACLAICKQHPIGIDVEYRDERHQWKKIINRFFTPPEQEQIFKLPESQQQQAFYQVWTRKEAHMKVTGEGLHLSPSQFTVSVPPDEARLVNSDIRDSNTNWQMKDIIFPELFDQYCGCYSSDREFSDQQQYMFP